MHLAQKRFVQFYFEKCHLSYCHRLIKDTMVAVRLENRFADDEEVRKRYFKELKTGFGLG